MSCKCKSKNTKIQESASAGNLQLQAWSTYLVYVGFYMAVSTNGPYRQS